MRPHKVLIVDDYEPLAEELALLLNGMGPFQARFVDNFKEAKAVALEMKPDICILDLWDEASNSLKGEEVAGEFLDHPQLVSIPVIFYTASEAIKHMGNIVCAGDFEDTDRLVMRATRPRAHAIHILTKGRVPITDIPKVILQVLKGIVGDA